MQETLQQYEQLVQNLERVVQADGGLHPSAPPQEGDEPPLQIILHNVYRYLTAVAANLDRLHEGVADAKQQFLDKRKDVRHAHLLCWLHNNSWRFGGLNAQHSGSFSDAFSNLSRV